MPGPVLFGLRFDSQAAGARPLKLRRVTPPRVLLQRFSLRRGRPSRVARTVPGRGLWDFHPFKYLLPPLNGLVPTALEPSGRTHLYRVRRPTDYCHRLWISPRPEGDIQTKASVTGLSSIPVSTDAELFRPLPGPSTTVREADGRWRLLETAPRAPQEPLALFRPDPIPGMQMPTANE